MLKLELSSQFKKDLKKIKKQGKNKEKLDDIVSFLQKEKEYQRLLKITIDHACEINLVWKEVTNSPLLHDPLLLSLLHHCIVPYHPFEQFCITIIKSFLFKYKKINKLLKGDQKS